MMEESKPEAFVVPSKQADPPSASMHRTSRRLIAFVIFMGILVILLVILQFCITRSDSSKTEETRIPKPCSGDCTITVVESIPENVKFPAGSIKNPSTYDGWMNLLSIAKKRIDIASFYWTLEGSDTNTSDYSTRQGENVFKKIQYVAKAGSIEAHIQTE